MTKSVMLTASEAHYRAHLQPIWDLIPEQYHHTRGMPTYMLVGGYADVKSYPTRDYIYVEHGAGQSYTDPVDPLNFRSTQSYYSGGRGHQRCALFICPNQEVADRWLARYPDKPVAVVGSPVLDRWHLSNTPEPKTVAITFHWDALFTGVPETSSAFNSYFPRLLEAVRAWKAQGWTVLGHHHPRYKAVGDFWSGPDAKAAGVEPATVEQVLNRASILVADNTSMQAEFLSLGRRVVWLNAPQYRRDVVHGGRFWDWPTMGGLQVDDPADLVGLNLDDVPETAGHPYAFADGHASERASSAIVSLLED